MWYKFYDSYSIILGSKVAIEKLLSLVLTIENFIMKVVEITDRRRLKKKLKPNIFQILRLL